MTKLVRPRPWSEAVADPETEAEFTCARIDETDADLCAFTAEDDRRDRLSAEAREVARRWQQAPSRPSLYGVPVGLKDVIHVDGLPTRAGSKVPAEALAGPQAGLVDRLREAGAIIAGKNTCAEFAISAPGPTRNPHHLEHTPGGSSSGSAAAVAAGQVRLSIGTQTVSSTTRPAAYCGVVGFKPSFGRAPVDGTIANAPTLDTIGILAADVATATHAAAALCDTWTPRTPDRLPVLGLPSPEYLRCVEKPALAEFTRHLQLLRDAGYRVVQGDAVNGFSHMRSVLFVIQRYESAAVHARWFDEYGELYLPRSAQSVQEGRQIDRQKYEVALQLRDTVAGLTRKAAEAAEVDVWVSPSATGPAPLGLESTGNSIMSIPWSLVGMPSLSVPAPSPSLPLGFHCAAEVGDDERLLAWGADIAARLAGLPRGAGRR